MRGWWILDGGWWRAEAGVGGWCGRSSLWEEEKEMSRAKLGMRQVAALLLPRYATERLERYLAPQHSLCSHASVA
jgi:hypothetical protein